MAENTDRLIQDYFVGRSKAFEEFDSFMQNPDKRVFFILGPGGIGKSWLVKGLIEYAHRKYTEALVADGIIDLLSTRNHRISELGVNIARLLGDLHEFGPYLREYAELRDLRAREGGFPHAERALQDKRAYVHRLFAEDCQRAIGNQVALLWFDTFEAVRNDPVGDWLLEELPRTVDNLRLIIAGRPNQQSVAREEANRVQRYQLSGLEASDVESFYQSRFERDGHGSAIPIETDMLGVTIPPTTEMWKRLCEKLDYHPLAMDLAILWVDSGIATYEELDQIPSGEIVRTVFSYLRRIGEVPGITPDPDDLEAHLEREEVQKIRTAAYRNLLYMAFLDRRFDEYFLERVYPVAFGHPELKYASMALKQMSKVPAVFFVKEREGGLNAGGYLQLHDEVRDQVREILWPVEDNPEKQGRPAGSLGEEREYLAREALEIYDQLIAESDEDREREELQVEKLGYLLRIDPKKGYDRFKGGFRRNLENRYWGICQLLLNEVSPYQSKEGPIRHDELQDFRFQLAKEQYYFEIARHLIDRPAQAADYWLQLHKYYLDRDLGRAEESGMKALCVCRDHNLVHRQAQAELALGFVSKALGRLEEAVEWYQKCQETSHELAPEMGGPLYAFAQNNEGYIWALIGEYETAREAVKNALRVRKDFGLEYEVAQSLSTLGEIERFDGNFAEAENYYRKSLQLFAQHHAHDWEARLWHQRAENARRRAVQESQSDYADRQKVQEYLNNAVEYVERSEEIFKDYRLQRELHKLLRRMGLIRRDLGIVESTQRGVERLEEAEDALVRAFDLAKQYNDPQEALECLIYIADLQIRQQHYGEATQTLANVEDFEDAHNFEVFLGLRDIRLTELEIPQGNTQQALDHYADGLVRLAQETGYGHARLERLVPRISDTLEQLPTPQERRRWCRFLLQSFEQDDMEQLFPQLLRAVKHYLDRLDFSAAAEAGPTGGVQE